MKDYPAIKNPRPEALVICCGDPRLGTVLPDFIKRSLSLAQGKFVLVIVAGGPASLAHRKTDADGYYYLTRQIAFYIQTFESIKRIIIIGNQDNGHYKNIINHPDTHEREKRDLPRAVAEIRRILENPEIKIEAYYAKFTDLCFSMVSFEEII